MRCSAGRTRYAASGKVKSVRARMVGDCRHECGSALSANPLPSVGAEFRPTAAAATAGWGCCPCGLAHTYMRTQTARGGGTTAGWGCCPSPVPRMQAEGSTCTWHGGCVLGRVRRRMPASWYGGKRYGTSSYYQAPSWARRSLGMSCRGPGESPLTPFPCPLLPYPGTPVPTGRRSAPRPWRHRPPLPRAWTCPAGRGRRCVWWGRLCCVRTVSVIMELQPPHRRALRCTGSCAGHTCGQRPAVWRRETVGHAQMTRAHNSGTLQMIAASVSGMLCIRPGAHSWYSWTRIARSRRWRPQYGVRCTAPHGTHVRGCSQDVAVIRLEHGRHLLARLGRSAQGRDEQT